jgi:hypothetical protein
MTRLIRVGFYRELKHGESTGPSLRESVQPKASADQAKVVGYLKSGKVYLATPGIVKDVLDPKAGVIGSPNIMTDGKYAWPADFTYYVEKHHAKPPEDLVAHMAANKWAVPNVDVKALELPPEGAVHRTAEEIAAHDQEAKDLAAAFVKAHLEYDDPAVAAAREAREAAKEAEDRVALEKFYVETGQKGANETIEQAIAKMVRHLAERIGRDAADLGEVKPILQPLPSPDPFGSAELSFGSLPAPERSRALTVRIENPNGKSTAPEVLKRGSNGEIVAYLRDPHTPVALVGVMKKLVETLPRK